MSNLFSNETQQQLFDEWTKGYGIIEHTPQTIDSVRAYLGQHNSHNTVASPLRPEEVLLLLKAADRVCNAGMWLVAHMTYANKVATNGERLAAQDFKAKAQGHTGGSLNMAIGYTGYLLANALSGRTRSWIMGQGHCVAAIESLNTILANQYPEKAEVYPPNESGFNRLCEDFYRYDLDADNNLVSQVGSHVNAATAGGIIEGGYLGFAALQYAHMPLPGQELVAFLSDGAFEEQRGSDWAPRWWRAEDTGIVVPVMVANGRRIDQRTMIAQEGGPGYLEQHLALHGFDPWVIDGKDPAAYAMAIIMASTTLANRAREVADNKASYPCRMPYIIAHVPKGYGLPQAGTNAAHSLPLGGSIRDDKQGQEAFYRATETLFVPPEALEKSTTTLNNHATTHRVKEQDHALRCFDKLTLHYPPVHYAHPGKEASSLSQMDKWFTEFMKGNTEVRFRLGNPDEIQSNRMSEALTYLKHRVVAPEDKDTESTTGGVITVLNEETAISAALANKQGVNLVVSYEAFAMKMLGAMRQEAIFSRNLQLANRQPNWTSVPVIATSHTWENGKNEQSHQDPKFAENWLCEMADTAPVYFPVDANSALAVLKHTYQTYGRIAVIVAAKKPLPTVIPATDADQAVKDGMFIMEAAGDAMVQLIAIGGYQLQATLQAAQQLRQNAISCTVIALLEPGKFRAPRDTHEADYCHSDERLQALLPQCKVQVVVSHTGADVIAGVLRRLDLGPQRSAFMGYKNHGGTLNLEGLQRVNSQTPDDIAKKAKHMLGNLH